MIRSVKTKTNRAKDSKIPTAAKHFPNSDGCLREAWIPVAATFPWKIADDIMAKPAKRPTKIAAIGETEPAAIFWFISNMRMKP